MIKDIAEKNNTISIDSIHKQKIDDIISKFKDSNNNFDLENFIKYLKDENVKVIREGYSLNFLGKRAAELQSALDSTTVFVPDIEHNSKSENKDSENIYISADNLEALRHLKKSYHNRIKCIYIDPPYNTGNDGFCYTDKFKYDKDELADKLGIDVTEAERILNMESTKSNSHSAWLSFMYARLLLAYELLKDEGVIFISIDDNEMPNLKLLCDDVFGEDNKLAVLPTVMNLKGNNDEYAFAGTHEYTLAYAKNKEKSNLNEFALEDENLNEWQEDEIGLFKIGATLKRTGNDSPREKRPNCFYPILVDQNNNVSTITRNEYEKIYKKSEKQFNDNYIEELRSKYENEKYKFILPIIDNQYASWRWTYETLRQNPNEIIATESNSLYKKQRPALGDLPSSKPKTIFYKPEYSSGNGTNQVKKLFNNKKVFSNPKPIDLIFDFLEIGCDDDCIFLDFFSGSGTSAISALQNNISFDKRIKFIIVQLPEDLDINFQNASTSNKDIIKNAIDICDSINKPHTIDNIGIERIKRAAKKIKEETNANIDYGFKHYTLIDKKDTLDTLEKFDSNFAVLTQDEILNEFSIESRLITFLCDDGFGLNAKYEEIDIAGYKCFLIDGFLYLLDKGFDSSQIASLIEKVDKKEIALRKIVIFGYAFDTRSLQQLKDNAEKMGLNDNKDIIVKY